MDLILFVTGLDIDAVFADLATLVPVRLRPKGALATFQTDDAGGGRVESEPIEIGTEDWGSVLFRFTNGARGTMCVSQVTAGRKNRITFEVACATASLAWDSEHPNDLWIGHRDKSNELLIRDPSLLAPEIRSFASYPSGHNEGFLTRSSNCTERFMITLRRKITHDQGFLPVLKMTTKRCCCAKRS
jgi:predicted dehydrogenase